MQWLASICVRRPVFAWVLIMVVVVLGVVGYSRLGVDQFPNIDVPIVVVTTQLPGASPEEVELDVTDKIEGAVNTISGIDELTSNSSEGISQVIIRFVLEKELETAVNDVRDKINQITQDLPEGTEPPVVTKVDPSATAVLLIGVRAQDEGIDIRELSEVADKTVRRQIETINGVGEVEIIGGRERQINVLMDPIALRAENVTAVDVLRTLQSQNLVTPGGSLEAGPRSLTLKIDGRVTTVDALERIVIRADSGRMLRLSDVAKVEDGKESIVSLARYDHEDLVVLSVVKQAGTNTIEVVDAVRARLDAVASTLPEGMALTLVRDNSQSIRTSVHAVTEHLAVGSVLAALVVLFFLGNARSTIIAAIAIPVSIIGTFGLLSIAGYTLNLITLLALALAVGIVIDDAIVVLENIVRFIDEKGMKPFPAAILATKEIGMAVMATTLSLMAVFIPVAFIGGIPGRFLKSFGYTMAFAVGLSLVVSFSLTPMMSARMLRPHKETFFTRLVDACYKPIESVYMALLGFSLRHRWVIVLVCMGALVATGPIAKSLPSSFLPEDDRAQFQMTVRAPEGTSSEETMLIAERAAVELRKLPGVTHTLVTVAEDDQRTRNYAQVYVDMTDPAERELSQFDVMDLARQQVVPTMPEDVRANVAEVPAISAGGNLQNIQYVLSGPDLDQLDEYATAITNRLRESKLAVDVDTTLLDPRPEIKVHIDRDRAADLGVRVTDIAQTLQMLVAGVKASTYPEDGEEYEVRIRAARSYREDASSLNTMSVPSSKYGSVPLAQVVHWEEGLAPSRISRYSRARQITLLANPAPGVGEGAVTDEIKKGFEALDAPETYRLQATGRSRSTEETKSGFALALGMAFVFMYLILAAQFESWLYPGIILVSLPLTVPFAMMALGIFNQSLNMFSLLGLLVLFGVVKKNSILQVDHTNHLRSLGVGRFDSLMEANRDRLRPILMTTVAFVAGMAPLIVSEGIGSGTNQATASIVIGGQTLSLLLTLLAVPVFHSLVDSARDLLGRFRGNRQQVDLGQSEVDAAIAGSLEQEDHKRQSAAE